MIDCQGLTKRYGQLLAVDNLSFAVRAGEVLGFLGPNGAGKTTTMRLITGFLSATAGRVSVCGHDVESRPTAAKRCIGYLPEGAPTYPEMTPRSFLEFIADVRGIPPARRKQRLDEVVGLLHLERVLDQTIDTLSKGYRRRVGLAQAIVHDPEVLILDEPTDGLDPNQKHEVRQLIGNMAKSKLVVISTHMLEEVDAVCNRVIIIAHGKICVDDTPAALEARSRFHNAVSIKLGDAAKLPQIRSAVAALPEVASTEVDSVAGRLTAFPAQGKFPLKPITLLAEQNRWHLAELHLESGRLDEVFRTVTGGSERVNGIMAVCKRELRSYFVTPVAYVFIVFFLLLAGWATFFPGRFYESGQADLGAFFSFHPWLYLILAPAVSMRLWAEERKQGSAELLMTLPLELWQAVLGKFLAAWAFTGIALSLTFPIWLTVNYLGNPDNGAIFTAYIGSLLLAGGFLALGACVSASTKSQIIAFIVTIVVCLLLLLAGTPFVLDFFSGWVPNAVIDAIASLSLYTHYNGLSRGVIDLRDVVFFALLIGTMLYANTIVLHLTSAD